MRGQKKRRKAERRYRLMLWRSFRQLRRLRGDHRRWFWEADWAECQAVLEDTTRARRIEVEELLEARL